MAIDGAAPNRPAKVLGRKVSLSAANADTAIPPAGTYSSIIFPYGTIRKITVILWRQFGASCAAPHIHSHGAFIMPNFVNLPPFTENGDAHVVVEPPRGSRAKFAYDPKLEAFILSKSLLTGLTYPHDWGFVPSTKADDGDPLDIMVIHDTATFPGIVLTCRIIGVLQIEQKSKGKAERNDRLFAVPRRSHSEQGLRDVRDLSKPIQQELEKFFIATDELEDKKLEIIGWKGPKIAIKAIKDCAKSFSRDGR
jgi:inorganic pyrophosphatase